MEIMKIFSSYDDYGYVDEKLYSVLLSEEELRIYSLWIEEQKEFVSKRAAKKMAKKALGAEQEFQTNIKNGMDSSKAQEIYDQQISRTRTQKGAGRVLQTTDSGVTIKAIKNDRAAEQIAGAIGDGTAETKERIANNLKKSKGGQGIDTAKHVAAGDYNAQGVKEGVANQKRSLVVERTERNSARKQVNEANRRVANAQMEKEAAIRKAQAKAQREIEKARKTAASKTTGGYQHQNNYLPKQSSAPASVVPTAPAPTTAVKAIETTTKGSTKNGMLKTAQEFAKRNKKTLAIAGTAAGLAAGGAYLMRRKSKEQG